MLELLIDLLLVASCIVYITDYVGFTGEIVNSIICLLTKGKIKNAKPRKLLSCSLCQVTWCTLIICLIYFPLTFKYLLYSVCLALVYGWSTQYILVIFNLIDNLITKVLGWIDLITK